MTSPWKKIEKPAEVNLEDIMSEEVARDLQDKENRKICEPIKNEVEITEEVAEVPPEVLKALSEDTYESDEMIARMLQMQFDKEHDEVLKRTEEKFNGASKVSISFDNYRRAPQSYDFLSDSEEEEVEDIMNKKDWDRFDTLKREFDSIPPCGYKVNVDGTMVTKHDGVMNGRKNACKMLSFPPEFQTGDGEGFDLKLSNKVFNSLKSHSKHEQVRRHRMHDRSDQATAEFGMDEYTRLLLYKMINKQLLERVNGVISIGKEAVILHADTDPHYSEAELPKECVIKVFKTTLSEFKQRDKYIKSDYRFKDRIGKQTARKTVHIWAEKEMANLMRLDRAGIMCPKVVQLKKHVLVMSFIGENHVPAPKLKDAIMKPVDYIMAYDQVVEQMKLLYEKANLIHADLSEYNILWYNKQCYFIDVSQSVEPTHDNAFHFLYRDCNNITHFFQKKGVPEMSTADELFKSVTGCDFVDTVALETIKENFKMKPHLVDKPGIELTVNFDNTWEKIQNKELPLKAEKSISEDDALKIVEPPTA